MSILSWLGDSVRALYAAYGAVQATVVLVIAVALIITGLLLLWNSGLLQWAVEMLG